MNDQDDFTSTLLYVVVILAILATLCVMSAGGGPGLSW